MFSARRSFSQNTAFSLDEETKSLTFYTTILQSPQLSSLTQINMFYLSSSPVPHFVVDTGTSVPFSMSMTTGSEFHIIFGKSYLNGPIYHKKVKEPIRSHAKN